MSEKQEVVVDKASSAKAEVDELVKKGLVALDQFMSLNQEQIDFIVAKMSVAGLDKHDKCQHLRRQLVPPQRVLRCD